MRPILTLFLLLSTGVLASAAPKKPRPEIMGISLEMSREDARTRLKPFGSLEREDRKRQEVWAVKDPRLSHLLIGYDADYRVRYITAIARPAGPRIRYQEVVDLRTAERTVNQGNHKFTWEIEAHRGQAAFIVIARGHDPQYLDSYSIKKADQEEID